MYCLKVLCCTLLCVSWGAAQHSEAFAEKMYRLQELQQRARLATSAAAITPGQEGFDVTYYGLDLRLSISGQTLRGSITIVARSLSTALSSMTLDLAQTMTVDSVKAGNTKVLFTRGTQTLSFPLDRTYASGEFVTATVFYGGTPGGTGFGSFAFRTAPDGTPWVWTLSEPYGARDWWPCKDHPDDKADSVDVIIRCDGTLKVGSQGALVVVVDHGDGTKTHFWRHRYPIATYLVSLAAANYSEVSGWFRYSPTDSMPVVNYALPLQLPSATSSLPLTIDMLHIFSDLYGLYPFVREKYGHAQFGWGGGMEHQTLTSLGSFSENLIAHELAHQWFGDMITMRTWPDIWLNEGFATYSVALYREKKYGPQAYRQVMESEMSNAKRATGTLYVQDTSRIQTLFDSRLVYSKGASVLHMLRRVLGDSVFFKAILKYATDPGLQYDNASTSDLRSVCESVSGKALGWFFDQWVYGSGYPSVQYDWSSVPDGSGALVEVRLRQINKSSLPPFFTMPLDIRCTDTNRDTTVTIIFDAQTQSFTMRLPFSPLSLLIDPDKGMLMDIERTLVSIRGEEEVPGGFALDQNYPNPFNGTTLIPFTLEDPSTVTLEVFSVLGERVALLQPNDRFPAGHHVLRFSPTDDSPDALPSGVYFYRLALPNRSPRVRTMVYLR